MDYLRLFRIILRYRWLLIVVTLVATGATFAGARLKGAAYQATATLMPQEQALTTLDGVVAVSSSLGEEETEKTPVQVRRARVESLIALMLSPRVLGQVIAKLQLPLTPNDLQRMVTVDQVTPEVLRVRAVAGSPDVAGELANGLASTFVQFYGDLSTTAISESMKLLSEQEQQAKKELLRCKEAVQKYKQAHHISSLQDQMNGVVSRLNAAQQACEGTKAQHSELSAQLAQVKSQLARTPAILKQVERSNDSPAAQQLRNEIATLQKDLALEQGVHTDEHPRVQDLKAKLASMTERLRREEGRLIERVRYISNPDHAALQQRLMDLQAQREGLSAKVASLERSVVDLEREMQGYTGADVQLTAFMQRYSAAEMRYNSVLLRLRQAEAKADSIRRSSAIAIIDTTGPMNPPVDVGRSRTMALTGAAFFMSFALLVFILAAHEYLDRGVHTSADAEAMIDLPVAAIIPRSLPRAASTPLPQLTALMPASPEGEAYRFLGLHLLLSRDDNPVRVLMMATAKPGQGATTTISNLAVTLAQGNRRVVLVDADLRRPSLHTIFDLPNEVGVTSVLADGMPLERAMQATPIPNLALLAGGPMVDNPWVLLRSSQMEAMVSRLRQIADFVLIDTPSAAAFADAFNVAPLADGVFMVVRSRHQPTGIELKIKRMFEEAGVKVFGAVLNDVPISNVESCRYHAHYYGPESTRAPGSSKAPALPAGKGSS